MGTEAADVASGTLASVTVLLLYEMPVTVPPAPSRHCTSLNCQSVGLFPSVIVTVSTPARKALAPELAVPPLVLVGVRFAGLVCQGDPTRSLVDVNENAGMLPGVESGPFDLLD